ncbi:MAG: TlpA family protein disulfide reductase [Armatimonadetes bacterium]|nr:TlpA family protein disulfide reductase [Armatimonadota bacterium]NOG92080.1 TlpA family protein disulfide reductase [Armatimonadota bacterium]
MSVPDMKQLYADLHDKGLEIVAVTSYYGFYKDQRDIKPDQEFEFMKGFVKEKEEPWPFVFGDRTTNHSAYGVSGIPHWAVLDRDGKVAFINIGYSADIFKAFRKKVEDLVNKKP